MKHFLLLLLGSGLLLTSAGAHAQLSVRLGANLAKLHTTTGLNSYNSAGSLAGYQVGLLYRLALGRVFALVPEVQYSRERSSLAQASFATYDASFAADFTQRLDLLSVPVLLRAALGPVYLEAGPQASLLLGARQVGTATTSGWGGHTTFPLDRTVTADYRRFDVGPCVGVGVKLPAGLGLSVRAYRGLVTLNHETSSYEGEYQRQSLQASLTYQLAPRQ